MSYEGYTQLLCAKGHQDCVDCYEDEPKTCRKKGCKEPIVWRNSVDVTNGSYDGKKRIDGYIELKKNPVKKCKCDKCGNEHFAKEITYKIPAKRKERQ